MHDPVIVSVARAAVGKAHKGSLRDTRPEEVGAAVLKGLIERTPGLEPGMIDDVVLGCAMPEGEQGMNITRIISLLAGVPAEVPAATINRFCSSGSQSIAWAADMVRVGHAEIVVAGGVESMSYVPLGGNKMVADPALIDCMPDAYMAMGTTAELVARRYGISREDQDRWAVGSHQKAIAANEKRLFADEIVPLEVRKLENGSWIELTHDLDEGPRPGTSLEALAKLRPVFDPKGTVTAGNTSQMNDGCGMVVVMSAERAAAMGLEPLVHVRSWVVAGVPPEVMGIGPAAAVPKLLAKEGLKPDDIDLMELNEAFASQTVYCVREIGVPEDRINVNGGAIAVGHPLGATGAILSIKLIGELQRRNAQRGIVTMCIGGGMGFAYLLERPAA